MSLARIKQRVPSAVSLGCHLLYRYDLRYHKSGKDGSAKFDAFFTDSTDDLIYGVLFEINPEEKYHLDRAEGLGMGYDEKSVNVLTLQGDEVATFTYVATHINVSLQPFSWYVKHVLEGAYEAFLPEEYCRKKLAAVQAVDDPDRGRDLRERSIHL